MPVHGLPCWAGLEVAGSDSHLVPQQHEHHIPLGVFLDLRQPGLCGESWDQSQGWSCPLVPHFFRCLFLEALACVEPRYPPHWSLIQVILLMDQMLPMHTGQHELRGAHQFLSFLRDLDAL